MKRDASKTRHATRKRAGQLDREIAAVLAKELPKAKKATAAQKHELFYLSEDQQGGKYAEHVERFDNLRDALIMLARLPTGSITYGNAAEGPKFLLVWAAPKYNSLLHWTGSGVQDATRKEAKAIRERQTKRYGDLQKHFENSFWSPGSRGF
jgi:hypothetical protein